MSWKKVKLREVLHQYRVTHLVQDATVYKQVTISKHDGVGYRGTKLGKEIGRKRQFLIDLQKHPNTFMFVRQGVSDGALGIAPLEVDGCIATENMPMFSVKGIEVDYLSLLLKSVDFKRQLEQIPTLGSAQKAIHERQLLEIEIPLPSIDEQRAVVKAVGESRAMVNKVLTETDHQLTLLTRLRQALLREAMQGRLLPQDPTDEPAAVLLQKLRAEKAPQGKAGKRPAAPLFAQEAEPVEGPFEIPASWVWCRFSEIITELKYGTSQSCDYDINKETRVLRIPNVSSGVIDGSDLKYTDLSEKEKKDLSLEAGDLLMIRSNGSRELVGRTAIVTAEYSGFCYAGYLIRIRMNRRVAYTEYILYALRSAFLREQIESPLRTTVGINNINTSEISSLIFPLPPLAEQQRIVAKLEQLLGHCAGLEARIRESARLAGQLLQTALREVLAPPAGAAAPPPPRVPAPGEQLALKGW